MTETIIIALLSLFGTLIGSLTGILTSKKLTNYRIQELEKKVEKHNSIIERVYKLEKHEAIAEEELKEVERRIDGLEKHK